MQTCEYRCNHLYQFPRTRLAERINSIRVESHYVFEEFGAACTAFNIAPEQNGNKDCKICEDPYFNPPECYKIKDEFGDYILKHDDCMTKCNMLPNCSNLCPNLLLETCRMLGKCRSFTWTVVFHNAVSSTARRWMYRGNVLS